MPYLQPKTSSNAAAPTLNKSARSASSDSSTSESSASSTTSRNTGAPLTTKEVKQKLIEKAPTPAPTPAPAVRSRASATAASNGSATPEKKPFQSRFLASHQAAAAAAAAAAAEKKEETESSSEEETSSEESEEEEEEPKPVVSRSNGTSSTVAPKPDITSLLNRSSNARDAQADNTRRNSRGDNNSPTYGRSFERDPSPKFSSTRNRPTRETYEEPSG